jgi:hypothetical protein
MNTKQSALTDILTECRSDYVGLWSVVRTVKEHVGDKTDLTNITMALIRKLLVEEGIVAGNFENHKFCVWQESVDETIHKITLEWQSLGREPTIGDVVWFTAREGLSDLPRKA